MAGEHGKKTSNAEAAKQVDASGVTVGRWAVGFCGCFTHCVPNCLMVWCLPCVSLAQIASRLGVAKFGRALVLYLLAVVLLLGLGVASSYLMVKHRLDSDRAESDASFYYDPDRTNHNQPVIVLVCLAVASAVLLALSASVGWLRAKTRARFDIPGSCCGDYCAALCCGFCATAQMATHVKSYTPGSCSFGPVDTLPPYNRSNAQD